MFYKFVDETTIKRAPNPLKVNGKDIFTNSEKTHNENGYYRLVEAEYPQDEKCYEPRYTKQGNEIVQSWVEVITEEFIGAESNEEI